MQKPQQPDFWIVIVWVRLCCRLLNWLCVQWKFKFKQQVSLLQMCIGCFLQVNLDFKTREIISESLQQPSPSCFVVAQRRIYGLMENGSFPRFIQSEQYKGLCHAGSSGLGKHRKPFQVKCTGDSVRHDSKPIILSWALFFAQGMMSRCGAGEQTLQWNLHLHLQMNLNTLCLTRLKAVI